MVKICEWLGVSPSSILNSDTGNNDQIAASIAALIQREPRLKEVFSSAVKRH
jgi:predicted component of type VI protein secretion system